MIKNDRQYRITRAEAQKFQSALATLEAQPLRPDSHPLLQKAEQDALRSQLEDLRSQIREYEALRDGKTTFIDVRSLSDLPRALVQARIAAGFSQKVLADRLGLKEQQIQRYEASDYAGVSISRLQDVCQALGLNVHEELFLPTPAFSPSKLFQRLNEIGLEKDFVLKRFVPASMAHTTKSGQHAEPASLAFHATTVASHIFGWTPAAILGTDRLWLDQGVLGAARFKLTAQAEEKKLSAYTIYAHYLALQLLSVIVDLPNKPIPTDPQQFRLQVLGAYGSLTFTNVLRYIWQLGIPVLPLNDPGAFHGACWRVNGRNVIVLKQQTRSLARWLFDLLHETSHAATDPADLERTVMESPEISEERRDSPEEQTASRFAGDVLLDGRAEEIAEKCVQATKRSRGPGSLQLLKSVVPAIASQEGVSTPALANYLAFRLSLQGENWWGAATNLQPQDENPWQQARDVLLEHINITRLKGIDRELLLLALSDKEA